MYNLCLYNSLPNIKIASTKLKGFADNKTDVAEITISAHERVEKTL